MAEFSLHCAVDNGDLKRVRELIDFSVNMNGRNNRGETPLMVAASRGHREIFDLLIQSGAQVNCEGDSNGWTPFHWASCKGWVEQVRLILEKGSVDLNAAADGDTPLILAALKEHRDIFNLLIQYGAQVNCGRDSDGWTPLHWACWREWVDQVRLILEKGVADLNAAAKDGKTPLVIAAIRESKEIFDILIQYGAQVNCLRDHDGWTSLHWACSKGLVDQVRLILESGGADLNAAAKGGETPLMIAARRVEGKEIFDLLIQYGAQVDCGRDNNGWTPIHWACCRGWVDQIRLILEKGVADLNDAAKDGQTPLILAARSGHNEIFDLLIQYGAQVNCGRDCDGWTPLHMASWEGWVDQVRLILEKGVADLNDTAKDGQTPLILAARRGHKEIFDLLIQSGAQVNCGRDRDGWTPLHYASWEGWVDQVRLILEKGVADLNDAAKDGETPLILAARRDRKEIFDLLIQYGAQVNCGRDSDGWTPLHYASWRGWVDQVRVILEIGVADLNAAANDGDTPLKVALECGYREIFILLFQYGAIMDFDYELISEHSFLEVVFKDVNLCTESIVNKFQCQSLPTLYRIPDIAKKLPLLENFKLKDQQTQEIAKFVESEVKTKKFCNVFNSKPIVLMIMCVQSLISHQSNRKISASSESNLPFKKRRLN